MLKSTNKPIAPRKTPDNLCLTEQKRIFIVPDVEGNLYQLLLYIQKYNRDNESSAPLDIILPEAMAVHFQMLLSYEEVMTNLDLLMAALSHGSQKFLTGRLESSFSAFRHKDMPMWLTQISFYIPDDMILVFLGDICEPTRAPAGQEDVFHHPLTLHYLVYNTHVMNPSASFVILGNRDGNKLRQLVETTQKLIDFLKAQAKVFLNNADDLIQALIDNKNDAQIENKIRDFWYKAVTQRMVEVEQTIWAVAHPGDFFIYTGMLTCIQQALCEASVSVASLKEKIQQELNNPRSVEQHVEYILANTQGAPLAFAAYAKEYAAIYGAELTPEKFIDEIFPLYMQMLEISKIIQIITKPDGSQLLFTHAYCGAHLIDLAWRLRDEVGSLEGVDLDANNLESIATFYNRMLSMSLSVDLWTPHYSIVGLLFQNLLLATDGRTPESRRLKGSPVTEYYALPNETASSAAQTAYNLASQALKAIFVGHLPQCHGSIVAQKNSDGRSILAFATDNGKLGYGVCAIDSQSRLTYYYAVNYQVLLQGKFSKKVYDKPLALLADAYPWLGKDILIAKTQKSLFPFEVQENLLDGPWRVDWMGRDDENQDSVILSRNTIAPPFANASIIIPRSLFDKLIEMSLQKDLEKVACLEEENTRLRQSLAALSHDNKYNSLSQIETILAQEVSWSIFAPEELKKIQAEVKAIKASLPDASPNEIVCSYPGFVVPLLSDKFHRMKQSLLAQAVTVLPEELLPYLTINEPTINSKKSVFEFYRRGAKELAATSTDISPGSRK